MKRRSLIILDCDGVLLDSEVLSAEVLLGEFAREGFAADIGYFFDNCLGRQFSEVAARIAGNFGRALPVAFEDRFRRLLLERFASELQPMPGAKSLLASLALPYCVATSSSPERAAASLKLAGLWPFIEHRLFCSAMVAHGKPAPDLFLHAARSCGADPATCLVVEDSDMGLMAARAAGMEAWRFTGGSHFRLARPGQGRQVAADREFDDLARLPELLAGR